MEGKYDGTGERARGKYRNVGNVGHVVAFGVFIFVALFSVNFTDE